MSSIGLNRRVVDMASRGRAGGRNPALTLKTDKIDYVKARQTRSEPPGIVLGWASAIARYLLTRQNELDSVPIEHNTSAKIFD